MMMTHHWIWNNEAILNFEIIKPFDRLRANGFNSSTKKLLQVQFEHEKIPVRAEPVEAYSNIEGL